MKTLAELTATDEPAIDLIREWAASSEDSCEILAPSPEREAVLLEVQVTTRSTLGAVAYETGGILADHGWIRFLGSGHSKLTRTIPGWNENRANGLYLVADDAVGGFFAMNGGAFEGNRGDIWYWSPDNLDWEELKIGYTDLMYRSLTGGMVEFYGDLRWSNWEPEVANLHGDRCFSFYPFLWTKEGKVETSHRGTVPVSEAYNLKVDTLHQLRQSDEL